MGIITIVAIVLVALAISGMGLSAFFSNVGTGIENVAADPFIQEQAEKIKTFAIEKGTEAGKQLLVQIIEGVK